MNALCVVHPEVRWGDCAPAQALSWNQDFCVPAVLQEVDYLSAVLTRVGLLAASEVLQVRRQHGYKTAHDGAKSEMCRRLFHWVK